MKDCVFCKIIKGELPSKKHYEDDNFIIIESIAPRAKKHYLLIPKEHYAGFSEQTQQQAQKLAEMIRNIPALAKNLGLEKGFKLIVNQGRDAGQSVFHLHVHILGGQKLEE